MSKPIRGTIETNLGLCDDEWVVEYMLYPTEPHERVEIEFRSATCNSREAAIPETSMEQIINCCLEDAANQADNDLADRDEAADALRERRLTD